MAKKKILALIYNSYKDPLFQSNLFLYLKEYAHENAECQTVLFTYEQAEFEIQDAEKQAIRQELADKYRIHWRPLRWHSGRFKLLKKGYDFLIVCFYILYYRVFGYNKIVSLGTVSGSFAYILSRIFWLDHYLYQCEPHSLFMRDSGVWAETSRAYRWLGYFERRAGMYSKIISTGTHHMIRHLEAQGSRAQKYYLPSCVQDARFQFRPEARTQIRQKLGISNDINILYLGKFGDLYYGEALIAFFAALYQLDARYYFTVITPNDLGEIRGYFEKYQLPAERFHLDYSPFEQVPDWISAADFGVVSVPPWPSQRFRSPIKVGEYLCCGLPYLVCAGISHDDEVALSKQVGAVVDSFSVENAPLAHEQISKLLAEEKEILQKRCRAAGVEYRGYSHLRATALEILEKL